MEFIWDEAKNEWLKQERFISFEEIAAAIRNELFHDVIENPARPDQLSFVLTIRDYTWLVPFVIDDDDRVVLKTAYPSRKYHRLYQGEQQ